jgi:hypothetical protein
MSIKSHHRDNVKILRHEDAQREPHAELADVALLDDAARRIARSGQALYLYYSQLDSLREVAKDVGNAVLAERSSRAELHTRLILSAGLDALNELQDLGVLQQSLRRAIAKPSAGNRTDEAVVRSAAAHRAWRISAFVHTHPGGAADMSGRDAVSFRRDTLPWVIVATNGAKVQQRTYTFLPDQGSFYEIELDQSG